MGCLVLSLLIIFSVNVIDSFISKIPYPKALKKYSIMSTANIVEDKRSLYESNVKYYVGTEQSKHSTSVAHWYNEELGVIISVGHSAIAPGLGLFVSVPMDVAGVRLPYGTKLCGYGYGSLVSKLESEENNIDKMCMYTFENIYDTLVILNNQLVTLRKALDSVPLISPTSIYGHEMIERIVEEQPWGPSSTLTKIEAEKKNPSNDTEKMYDIKVNEDLLLKYFVPCRNSSIASHELELGAFGQYGNDLAYYDGISENDYNSEINSDDRHNILTLAWEMVVIGGVLHPRSPVMVIQRETLFKNKLPLEVGNKYGYWYWRWHRDKFGY